MNSITNYSIKKLLALAMVTMLMQTISFAQTTYNGTGVDLVVSGTSTLHDWNMKSAKADCTVVFAFNSAGHITRVESFSFSTPADALKSDHSAMDKNAYKALKTDKNPAITYTMITASVTAGDTGSSTVKLKGQLSIAGATVDQELIAVCKTNADKTISVSGSRKISMKDFNMQPPTFMLGTVKTGNDVTLKFNMILKKG